ncbi:dipeptide epimerase [Hydrogenimonas cancrithermarum]|uniref:Dipeptide epimerase n=1 Tax=Hydrogenimonas cancrithermarum TaxID=2993563 RepID=A0ABM8FMP5_9BACT|nr:dipeptide epimerase [Hydrogenimonas cancrithermarum]BDY12883.1 dipeptide epimerase [Hydrogenimonas cancrithermarum]BDY13000.1 dipeptide epimerase [Hydrogenimonas cancrithermarum]
MTITDIVFSTVEIPLKTPFVTALRRVENVEAVRVTLSTDGGLQGIGEAPPTEVITGENLQSIRSTIEAKIAPNMLHKPFETMEEVQKILHTSCKGATSAKAAVDIALYDLFCKQTCQPLYRFLGGENRSVETDVTISLNDPGTMAADARIALAEGFDILKVKVGGRDGRDIARLEGVRRAVPDALLLVDANQAWSETEALKMIGAVSDLGIELIEQPLPAENLEGMQAVTAQSPIPILADESVFTLEDAKRVIGTKAAEMINIKLMKCGGIYKAREIVEWCEARGVKCMMGSMLESPASIKAALQLAMAYPETIRYADLDSPLLYESIPQGSGMAFKGNEIFLS